MINMLFTYIIDKLFTYGINRFNQKNRLRFWSFSNMCVLKYYI